VNDRVDGTVNIAGLLTGNSGAGGSGTSLVKTFIPTLDEAVRRKLFQNSVAQFEENQNVPFWGFFGDRSSGFKLDSSLLWPKCSLSQSNSAEKSYERKFIGLLVANPFKLSDEKMLEACCSFVFYKEKSCNVEKAIILSFNEMQYFLDASRKFLNYLKELDGSVIVVGDALPNCPKPEVIKQCSATQRIVLMVDGWAGTRIHTASNKLLITISLKKQNKRVKIQQRGKPGIATWDSEFDAGITITGPTLFNLIEGIWANVLLRFIQNMLYPLREVFDQEMERLRQYASEDVEPFDDDETSVGDFREPEGKNIMIVKLFCNSLKRCTFILTKTNFLKIVMFL
jgi:hypothetical protein